MSLDYRLPAPAIVGLTIATSLPVVFALAPRWWGFPNQLFHIALAVSGSSWGGYIALVAARCIVRHCQRYLHHELADTRRDQQQEAATTRRHTDKRADELDKRIDELRAELRDEMHVIQDALLIKHAKDQQHANLHVIHERKR